MESLLDIYSKILQPALIETFSMVVQSTLYSILLGFIPAIILVVTNPKGLRPQRTVYRVLDFVINILRSFPFLILMICLIPFTRVIVGTSIGTEALPSIVQGITLTLISIVGYSAMAGTIGGGGLGNVAMKYGYYRYETDIMIYTVVLLIIMVQIFQTIGNLIYKKLTK